MPSMKYSQDFTVRSNARRAARKAGVDPADVTVIVKAGKKHYRFPMPADTNGLRRLGAEDAKQLRGRERVKRVTAATKTRIEKGLTAKKKPAKKAKAPKAAKSSVKPGTGGFGLAVPRKAKKDAAPKGDRGLKLVAVAALLRRDGGASITEVCAATGWKPHSARARISVDVSKLLDRGEEIQRRRENGVSHYAIVKSKQLELPVGQEAA